MKRLSFFYKIIFLINNIFAIVLVFCFFVPIISPDNYSGVVMLGLLTPALLIVNFFFVIFWIVVGFKKQVILPLLVLIVSYFVLPSVYKLNTGDGAVDDSSLSIMTYNVRRLNKYKWIDSDSIGSKISLFIKEKNPDVLLLQEYEDSGRFRSDFPYSYNPINRARNKSNLIIWSKYPIVNSGKIEHKKYIHSSIYADIVKNNDTLRIYNFHLQSLGVIPDEDYFGHKDSEKLIKRLGESFKIQQLQIEALKNHLESRNYRVIVAGDMNNTAYTWAYKNVRNHLKDTFLEAGKGFGKTYTFKGFPLRIDYIFVDKDIKIMEHKNFKEQYSDHYPISATLEL